MHNPDVREARPSSTTVLPVPHPESPLRNAEKIGEFSSVTSSDIESRSAQLAALVGASTPIWPSPGGNFFYEWVRFRIYPNFLAAHIVAGRLEVEGVPVVVEDAGAFPDGANSAALWVPKALLHRARWVTLWPPPTDEELTFLAIGELPSDGVDQ